MPPRGGDLEFEANARHRGIERQPSSPRGEDSLSPKAPGAEALPIAPLARNSSPAATGAGRPRPHLTSAQVRRTAGCALAGALGRAEEQARCVQLGPKSMRHLCDPACLFLSNNLSQFYRIQARRVKLAKARAATVSPTPIPSQGPVPFSRAPIQGRGGPGSLCLVGLLSLYRHRVIPAQTTASQSLTPKRGSQ